MRGNEDDEEEEEDGWEGGEDVLPLYVKEIKLLFVSNCMGNTIYLLLQNFENGFFYSSITKSTSHMRSVFQSKL